MAQHERLQWLDALRGFTMILVVAYHVAQITFSQNLKSSASLPFLALMRMPLFFFVSGYLSYRVSWEWSVNRVGHELWKKLLVQVIPALLFLCLYVIFRQKGSFETNFMNLLSHSTKGGYWFTWVLLQMYVLYYLTLLPIPSGQWQHGAVCVLWILSIGVYSTLYMPKIFTYFRHPFFNYTSLVECMRFFQFFLFGNLVHRLLPHARRMADQVWFFPLLVILALWCTADIFRLHQLKFMWTNLPRTLDMYALMLITVLTFRHYGEALSSHTFLGRTLQYIGRRTLDIYLIHFLVLPSLPMVGRWLNAHQPNFLLDLSMSLLVALPIVALSCLVSHILRVSPVFSHYLFGQKSDSR